MEKTQGHPWPPHHAHTKEVGWGERVGLQWRRDKVGRAQLSGRGGCTWMKAQLLNPPLGGRPVSPPVPGVTVNLCEQSSNTSRPVNYGAQPSIYIRNAWSLSTGRLYLFPCC